MKHALRLERQMARSCAAIVTCSFLSLTICTASARILRTRPTPSETWNLWLLLTIGSAVEFDTTSEGSTYDFPMLLEYNFTQTLKLTIEPALVHFDAKSSDA